MFLIDSSGSIKYDYPELKQFVADIINLLPQSGTQVGAALYSDKALPFFDLNTYSSLNQSSSAVLNAPYRDRDTNITGALNYARTVLFTPLRGDRPGVQNLVILITDGVENVEVNNLIPSAQQLHATGAQVICIGIGTGVNETELSQISSPPHIEGRNYLLVTDFVSLTSSINSLLSLISSWQTISSSTTAITQGRLNICYVYFICVAL